MEEVPNELLLDKDLLTQQKPHQFLQRIKSKSELQQKHPHTTSAKLREGVGDLIDGDSVEGGRMKFNNGDEDIHHTVSGFYSHIQKSKFSNNMAIQNEQHR